ncbi:MAG TPA: 1-deoxy-D-xylulose-5-phosphate reductoisomerase [Chloroflexota bacterium]|nr:1-deoxy-D-xylulose-5-phosphate reductoisomerase [Chloroflexota bacterium]
MTRSIVIVGSTGSIGQQALEVVRAHPAELRVVGLAAGKRLDVLARQVHDFKPSYVNAPSLTAAQEWHGAITTTLENLCELPEADLVLIATVGSTGLAPTLTAIRARKLVALANKEVLVMAGQWVMAEAQRVGVPILPVDSEHSAVWQCFAGDCRLGGDLACSSIERIILTASGGAFRDRPIEELAAVSREEALAHPNWVMGPKVTIDSATLMNKGFEVIEAHWLFGLPYEKIDVLLHRESIVHALVEFYDGSLRAALGPPDMRIPVQHALTYPERFPASWPRLKLTEIGKLSFSPLNRRRYPCFNLALDAAKTGGTAPAVLSAADDVAVRLFLEGKIGFADIPNVVDRALQAHRLIAQPTLDDVLDADRRTREDLEASLDRGTRRA